MEERTPGSWELAPDRWWAVRSTQDKKTIVTAAVAGRSKEEMLANARFIATAPDLLEDLEWAHSELCPQPAWCESNHPVLKPRHDKIRATIANTTEQLPLHRRHKTRAGGVVIPKDTLHSSHGPGSQKGGEEPQTAGKTTAGQRARPVHQMPARTRQAKQGPLRAVLQQGPRIPSWEKAEAKRAQSAGE